MLECQEMESKTDNGGYISPKYQKAKPAGVRGGRNHYKRTNCKNGGIGDDVEWQKVNITLDWISLRTFEFGIGSSTWCTPCHRHFAASPEGKLLMEVKTCWKSLSKPMHVKVSDAEMPRKGHSRAWWNDKTPSEWDPKSTASWGYQVVCTGVLFRPASKETSQKDEPACRVRGGRHPPKSPEFGSQPGTQWSSLTAGSLEPVCKRDKWRSGTWEKGLQRAAQQNA